MGVTIIEPGRLVRVDPDELDASDVLELGEALIEEHGHFVGDSGDVSRGFSIHGAIGEAAKRATGESAKDGTRSRVLRDAAKAQIEEAHAGMNEFEINDTATTKDDAMARMRAGRARRS